MANIGEQLTTPETGWIRYSNENPLIEYTGNWTHRVGGPSHDGTDSYSSTLNDYVKFKVKASRIRIISVMSFEMASQIEIDINGAKEIFSENDGSSGKWTTLVFQKELNPLENTFITIKKTDNTNKYIGIDAIDLDSSGVLLPYKSTSSMIIKSGNKFYVQPPERDAIIEIPEANLNYADRYGSPEFTDFTKIINTVQTVINPGTPAESLQATVVEPFCLYDFFEDEVEVIYLTDDEVKPTELSIECDWSPLDELGDDFEVVMWTSENNSADSRAISIDAIPLPQTLVAHKPLYFEELQKVEVSYREVGCGKVFIHVSGDKGVTWHKYRASALNALSTSDLQTLFKNKEFMYKVELERDHNEDVATFSSIKINDKDYYATINFKDFLLSVESVMEKMPRIYVSYDNEATWVEVKQHEVNNLGQEEIEKMTLKVVLENGQQLYALAYSWI